MNYDIFHFGAKIQKKVITENNFTYRHVLSTINDIPKIYNGEILDYGCGVGTVDFYLAQKGYKVLGLEVSQKAIDLCKASSKSIGIENECQFSNINTKINKKFDLVICSEVIEHVKNDQELLIKLANKVRKGGYMFISTPSLNAPLFRLGLLNEFDKRVGHLRRYDEENLRKKIENAGLRIISFKKNEGILRNLLFTVPSLGFIIKFIKGPISDIVTLIDELFVKFFGESNYIVLGIK